MEILSQHGEAHGKRVENKMQAGVVWDLMR